MTAPWNFYSGWYSVPNGGAKYRLRLTCVLAGQDVAANTSTVDWYLVIEKDRSFSGFYLYTASWDVVVDSISSASGSGQNPSAPWTRNSQHTVTQGRSAITHGTNGKKNLAVSGYWHRTANGWSPGNMDVAGSFDLPDIARATVPTVTPSPAAVGATVTISLPRAVGTYKHDVTWVSGNLSGTVGTDLDDSTTWTVPDVMDEFPGEPSAPIVLTVVTKTGVGGTVLGAKQLTLFAKEPPAPPTITPYDPSNILDIRVRQVTYADDEWLARDTVEATGIQAVIPASATSTCTVTLNKIVAIDYPEQSIVDLDVWDGENWVFSQHRFVLNRADGDDVDPAKAFNFSGTEFIDYMMTVGYTQRDWEWANATPGQIMADLIADAKTRGWGPRMELNFSATETSYGETWANTIPERKVSKGTPLSQVLDGLVTDGYLEYRTRYGSNNAYLVALNPGTGQSFTDVGAPSVINLALAELSRAPRRGDSSKRITRVTVTGDDTVQRTRERAPFDVDVFGALEGWVSASGVSTDAGADAVGDNALRDNFAVVSERTFEYDNTISPQYYPILRYVPGDWLLIPSSDGPMVDRVAQVTIDKQLDSFKITALTGDRILSGTASLAKRQSAQVGGSISGGNGSTPSPLDSRIPDEPVVIDITSEGYWNLDGAARSSVTLSWAAVTEAMSGAPISVDLYEVWSRPALGGEFALHTTTNMLEVVMDDLDPLKNLEFRVRGRSAAGIFGEFSEIQEITTLEPATDLDGPDLADLYSDGVGGIYAVWGGTLDGLPAPSRVAYVVAEVSADGGVVYTQAGTPIVAAGAIVWNVNGAYGEYEVRLRAFDRLGNPGDASDPQTVSVIEPAGGAIQPLPPTDLAATPGAGWNAQGTSPIAWFDLTWTAPTDDIDGNPVGIVGYDVWGMKVGDPEPRFLTSTVNTNVRWFVGNLEEWSFYVTATSSTGTPSEPSASITDVADATISTAPAPTAPTLEQYAGILKVKWAGGGMQPYIKYAYAMISSDDVTYTRAGMPLIGAGDVVIANLAPGPYYAKIVMVDELGQTSTSAAAGPIDLLPITGVTYQTSPLANTGIKITSGSLTAYDGTGTPTFILDATTGEVWIAPYDAVFEFGADGFEAETGNPTTGLAISSEDSSYNTFIHAAGFQIRNDQDPLAWLEADPTDGGIVNFVAPRARIANRLGIPGTFEGVREEDGAGDPMLVFRWKDD